MNPPRTASQPRLARWLDERRWYARGDEPAEIDAVHRFPLPSSPPVDVVVVDTAGGDRYQLVQSDSTPDRADKPQTAAALAAWIADGATTAAGAAGQGQVRATWLADEPIGSGATRALGTEQSNTSVAVGGTHVLKVLRRLQPGPHPEVDVGRHLRGSGAPVPALAGWYELDEGGATTVLGVVHDLVAGALDGWALVLSGLAADPDAVLARLRELGVAVARLHRALAAPGPGFDIAPLAATEVWAQADAILGHPMLPGDAHHAVARAATAVGDDTGAAIRTHGDLHLGQTLVGPDGWMILDFEGEPARPLTERAQRTSPLRDVAGMLRSLSYAAASHRRAEAGRLSPGWEPAARAALLDGYLASVDPGLLPASAARTVALLALYELEKVLYEIDYERAHRPDWEPIPREGMQAVLARLDR